MTADAILPVAMPSQPSDVTDLLDAWSAGDPGALDELMPLVVDELHGIASRQFHREAGDHTLQPTAIVNEAFLRLRGQRKVQWHNRVEFFAVAARLIRRILVDHARRRQRVKRGAGVKPLPLEEVFGLGTERAPNLVALDDALEGLSRLAPRQGRIVELRIFGGLTLDEAANTLDVGRSTVQRDWNAALLWLRRELS